MWSTCRCIIITSYITGYSTLGVESAGEIMYLIWPAEKDLELVPL